MRNLVFIFATTTSFLMFTLFAKAEVIPFNDPQWSFFGQNTKLVHYKGRDTLYTPGGGGSLNNAEFKNGIIEFDILFPDDTRGFSGVSWRRQPDGSYENFYIRPHLSEKDDGTQYTPSFKGDTGWQLYFGEHNTVNLKHKYDEWMHIKIVVSGDQAEVYVDSEKPVLFINDLKADLDRGAISLSTNLAPTFFSNFSYEKIDNPLLIGSPPPAEELPDHLIKSFQISELVSDDDANPTDYAGNWVKTDIETMGAVNISRYRDRSENNNTVFAKITVDADQNLLKKFIYGYSDEVIVYVNGMPIAGGDNTYQTRDYRYLGTIGLFDHVYLPLSQGRNEIIFAVKENFGGWGLMGRFDDMEGIRISE